MRLVFFAASLAALLVVGTPLHAEDATARAAEAYAQGVKLHKQKDYVRAAESFAHADELVPSPVALRAALDEAMLAEDPVLCMTLAERVANRSGSDAALRERASAARAKFASKTGRLTIACASGEKCMATIDGAAATIGAPQYVRAGQHTIVAQLGEDAQPRLVDVPAGETVETVFKPKREAAPAPTPAVAASTENAAAHPPAADEGTTKRGGVSPVVFYVGAGLTVAAGAATIVSGLDTKSIYGDFTAKHCDQINASGCSDLGVRGTNARTRTNVLAAGTGVVGVATAVIGLFFVRWSSESSSSAASSSRGITARLVPAGNGAALAGSF